MKMNIDYSSSLIFLITHYLTQTCESYELIPQIFDPTISEFLRNELRSYESLFHELCCANFHEL